jgi:hypothetical protein
MAKIHEEIITIKLSKLMKDEEPAGPGSIATADVVQAITAVSEELVGPGVVVEVELIQ